MAKRIKSKKIELAYLVGTFAGFGSVGDVKIPLCYDNEVFPSEEHKTQIATWLRSEWKYCVGFPVSDPAALSITTDRIPDMLKFIKQLADTDARWSQRPATKALLHLRLAFALSFASGTTPYWIQDIFGHILTETMLFHPGEMSSFAIYTKDFAAALPMMEASLTLQCVHTAPLGVIRLTPNTVSQLRTDRLHLTHCLAVAANIVDFAIHRIREAEQRCYAEAMRQRETATRYAQLVDRINGVVHAATHTALVNYFDPAYRPAFDFEACIQKHLKENE